MKSKRIWSVDMDHSDWSEKGLATTGVGPCYCFIVIVNHGEHVFIEHRSDALVASEVVECDVTQHFEKVAKQVNKVLPRSTIT